MADELNPQVTISSRADTSGADKMAAGLKGTADAGREATTSFQELKAGTAQLATALGAIVGIAEVVSLFKEMALAAYEDEKALRLVASTAVSFGHNIDAAKQQTEQFALTMERATAISHDEFIVALGRSYQAAGDLEQAMKRTSIAGVMAANGLTDMASAERIVDEVARGHTMRLERLLHVTIQGNDETEKAENGLKLLQQRFGSLSSIVEDHARQVDRGKREWELFKEGIGEKLLSAFVAVKEALKGLGTALKDVGADFAAWVSAGASHVAAYVTFINDVAAEDEKAYEKFRKTTAEIAKDFDAKSAAGAKADEDRKRAALWKQYELENQLNNEKLKRDTATGQKEKELEKDLKDWTLEQLRSRVAAESDTYKKLQLQFEVFKKERLEAEKALWKQGGDTQVQFRKIQEIEQNKRLAAQKQFDKALLDEQRKLDKNIVEMETELAKKISHIKKALFDDAMQQIRERKKQEELLAQFESDMANGMLALGAAAFGESKELAIAAAIVSTYEGAAKAIAAYAAYPPLAVAMAAIIIATGLAQVAKIQSTEPASGSSTKGSGFDDPENDAAARLGGRRWAKDFTREVVGGMAEQFDSLRTSVRNPGTVTNNSNVNNSRSTTIMFQNAGLLDTADKAWLVKLSRALKTVERDVDGRTYVGRAG